MKTKDQLQHIINQIANPASPVGMDAVYVHAMILDNLENIERRLTQVETRLSELETDSVER